MTTTLFLCASSRATRAFDESHRSFLEEESEKFVSRVKAKMEREYAKALVWEYFFINSLSLGLSMSLNLNPFFSFAHSHN